MRCSRSCRTARRARRAKRARRPKPNPPPHRPPRANRPPRDPMSQAEDPRRLERASAREVTIEDVRALMGASTPHFALQLRERIVRLIADLPAEHPARVEGQREIARLQRLGLEG